VLLSTNFVRENILPGLPLVDSTGQPLSDRALDFRVQSTIAWFERRFGVRLKPTTIKLGREVLPGELPEHDETLPALPYRAAGVHGQTYHIMRLPIGPIRQIHAVGLWLPGMPSGSRLPTDWVYDWPRPATVQIYPGRTLTIPNVYGPGFLTMVNMARNVPQAWHFSYTAGYDENDLQGPWADVLLNVAKMAAMEILAPGSLDRNFVAGVQGRSVGVDGLSQSVQFMNTPDGLKYSNLWGHLKEEVQEWLKSFWANKSGFMLEVL